MNVLELTDGWTIELDRGPDWLFVRLSPPPNPFQDNANLASQLWQVLENAFTYRVVLEFDNVPLLHSHLIGELVRLSRRIEAHGGLLRLCGMSDDNLRALRITGVATHIPHFANRGDAVMGHAPQKPR